VTVTDAAVVLLALLLLINLRVLILLRRRTTRTEIDIAVQRLDLRQLERDLETVWISPNHQLPKLDLKPDRGIKR
jgi:hypothetical protein